MKLFQSFRLDTTNKCLWHSDERVPLRPKAFDLLRYLVDHPGRLITQDEMLEAIWPGTYVNPEVIKKYILALRKVLGDDADSPTFIATIPKRGYEFVATVNSQSDGVLHESSVKEHIVGRHGELARLDARLDRVLSGQRQVIFVTGEGGIGKTTLVDAFCSAASQHRNLRIARGQCVEGFGGKEAYYPVLEALGQLTRSGESSHVVQVLANRAPTWLIQLPALVAAEHREGLKREILGANRERMVREICEGLETLTSESPLILLLEDLHWADPSTLDVISALARRREPAKLMLVGTYRPVEVVLSQSPLKPLKQDLQVHRLSEEIALERLQESDVAEFLASEFGGLPTGLGQLIYKNSGGNALFMVTILQDLQTRSLITHTEEGWALSAPLDKIAITVPETLQQLLTDELHGLSEVERRTLEIAAVAGERFSLTAIVPMLGTPMEDIEEICERLSDRGQFIKSVGVQDSDTDNAAACYEFKHSLYRQVVYRSLSDVTRAKVHRSLGRQLADAWTPEKGELSSAIALHFEEGRDYERAINFFVRTAENATRRFAYQDSINVLKHALSLVPKTPPPIRARLEIGLLDRMGDAHYALGDMKASSLALQTAAIRAADAGLKSDEVNVLNALSRSLIIVDVDQGLAAGRRALKVCEEIDDPLLLARTQLLGACLRLEYDRWRKEDAEACASARVTISRLSDGAKSHDEGICKYYEVWDTNRLTLQGEFEAALRTAEVGLASINESAHLVAYTFALHGKCIALLRLGQLGKALEMIRTARAQAEKNGNKAWLFMLREVWIRVVVFDFEGARQLCEEIVAAQAPYMAGQPNAMSLIARGYTALYAKDYELALRSFSEARRDPPSKFFLHWYWRMHAELGLVNSLLGNRDIVTARDEADHFFKSAWLTADPAFHALAWELRARVAIAEEDWSNAGDYVHEAEKLTEQFKIPNPAWRVHSTAWRIFSHKGIEHEARKHRALAEQYIFELANSFSEDEPLRATLLTAEPVRAILGNAS